MTVTVELPEAAQARLEAEAARRGITLAQLVAEAAEQVAQRLPAERPPDTGEGESETPRRKLGFVGIGASKAGITHQIDELLAEGFGRD